MTINIEESLQKRLDFYREIHDLDLPDDTIISFYMGKEILSLIELTLDLANRVRSNERDLSGL